MYAFAHEFHVQYVSSHAKVLENNYANCHSFFLEVTIILNPPRILGKIKHVRVVDTSVFSGMGIVEWWNGGTFFWSILFACFLIHLLP